jgi:heme o synthase
MVIKSSALINSGKIKLQNYWILIKSLQTGLLVITGFTGYISARCPVMTWETLLGLCGSLFLTISGSTVLNMVYDRDIDAKMNRTSHRPLPSGRVRSAEALMLGILLSFFGLVWAYFLSPIYTTVVFSGLFIDVIIYTVWLKRKTPFSIIWGGISGGMPILAGRVLGLGQIDSIGILLAVSILLWIPTHILTFNMRNFDDYNRAGIPTIPSIYGYKNTRVIIALSCIGAAVAIGLGSYALGLAWGYLRLLAVLTVGFIGLAIYSIKRPSERVNFGLFKYASLFMLGSMWMMVFGALK